MRSVWIEERVVPLDLAAAKAPFVPALMRFEHALSRVFVKAEDASRACAIELPDGVVVQFYAIFDGHGGDRAAHYCAEHLPGLIATLYGEAAAGSRSLRLQAACKAAFVALDEQVREVGPSADGTTATCVIIDGEEVIVANVGDSAAVLFLPGEEPIYLSTDHRVSRRSPAEHSRLTEAGAQVGRILGCHGGPVGPERIFPGGLAISRSIGDGDSTAAAIAVPDVRTVTCPTGGMIVLASDGVWDFVREAHVERLAAASRKPKRGAGWLCSALMRAASQSNHAIDDATLLCIELGTGGEARRRRSSMGERLKAMLGLSPGGSSRRVSAPHAPRSMSSPDSDAALPGDAGDSPLKRASWSALSVDSDDSTHHGRTGGGART